MSQLPTASDLAGIPAVSELTAEEAQFVYLVEVLGMPVKVAAAQAGVPVTMASKPHLQQARELLKREVQGRLPTKDDIVHRMLDAVERAKILAEPATEIIGLKEAAKLMGYDSPQKLDINITASLEVLKQHVGTMDDSKLAELVGAGQVIDAAFYRVGHTRDEA